MIDLRQICFQKTTSFTFSRTRIPQIPTEFCDAVAKNIRVNSCKSVFNIKSVFKKISAIEDKAKPRFMIDLRKIYFPQKPTSSHLNYQLSIFNYQLQFLIRPISANPCSKNTTSVFKYHRVLPQITSPAYSIFFPSTVQKIIFMSFQNE